MSEPPSHSSLHWDEQGQPLSASFGDVYFSRHDGLAETRHVFLEANQLPERFAALAPVHGQPEPIFTIAETGFGTGLNFLAAWQLWRQVAPVGVRLQFISVEKYPLGREDIKRALSLWPELGDLPQALLAQYPDYLGPGVYRMHFGSVSLTLIIDDAVAAFEQCLTSTDARWRSPRFRADAWFLDGFAPSKNPEMWREELFAVMAELSGPATTAATFSSAGIVKRGLKAAGFAIVKVPGYGRKREMLRAQWQVSGAPTASAAQRALDIHPRATHSGGKHALVIGAGLAGCHTARSLALRGWQVQVLERDTVASQGSGNPQGLLYSKLSHRAETLPAFNLQALVYAQGYYAPLWQEYRELGEACGVLQMATSEDKARAQQDVMAALGESQQLVRRLSAEQASDLAGLPLAAGGLFFPGCGWIDPRALCRILLEHPNIQVQTHCAIDQLAFDGHNWRASDSEGREWQGDVAVIACAHFSGQFAPLAHLPLKPIRGQVSYLPATRESRQLRIALCERGYLAPARERRHCLGATFNLGETELTPTARDHSDNLAHLGDFGPALADSLGGYPPQALEGRAAFRCTTPDYLPIVGPVADVDAFKEVYAPLARNARAQITASTPYVPGLYVNTGHGSRGLAYTPLAAELLASTINAEPLPLTRELAKALHPARFLLRDIIRSNAKR